MWTCPRCQAKVDDGFLICWRCGTSSHGDEDPDFVHADDFAPINRPSISLYVKAAKFAELDWEEPLDEVQACYWARNCNEAMFLANQLLLEGIPAAADGLDLGIVFAGFFGLVPAGPYFCPRVWAFARDVPKARSFLADYEQRKRSNRHLTRVNR
jgi:hypothetical protein